MIFFSEVCCGKETKRRKAGVNILVNFFRYRPRALLEAFVKGNSVHMPKIGCALKILMSSSRKCVVRISRTVETRRHLDRTVCGLVAEKLAGSRMLHSFVLSAEAVGFLLQLL